MQMLEIHPSMFLLRWIRLLLCREFALEDVLYLWDRLFLRALPDFPAVPYLCVCIDSAGIEREDKGLRIDLDVALSNAGRTEIIKHECGMGTSDAVMAGTREREVLLNDRNTKWLNMRKW